MSKTNLHAVASTLPAAWRSKVIGQAAGANFKVVRMDGAEYPDEVHEYDEALLVLEGRMNLRFDDRVVEVAGGEVYIVPAGIPHSVAPGSRGTLVIIDRNA
jgi:mannose-6-phosphate isomerase-like protein (cupin superfamily)